MFLFSGTFFPLSGLPSWAESAALALPLYHLVEMMRFLCIGAAESRPVFDVTYLSMMSLVFGYTALQAMKRRLVR